MNRLMAVLLPLQYMALTSLPAQGAETSRTLPTPLRQVYTRVTDPRIRQAITRLGRFWGWQYELGQKGYGRNKRIDCSGLVEQAFPTLKGRSARMQFAATTQGGKRVLGRYLLRPGHLVFFRLTPQALAVARAKGEAVHWHTGVCLNTPSTDGGRIVFLHSGVSRGVSVAILRPGNDRFGPTLVFAGGGVPPELRGSPPSLPPAVLVRSVSLAQASRSR